MTLTKQALLLLAGLMFGAGMAAAHGPTPQKGEEKIIIAAPPDKVWAVIKEFGSFAEWNPAVTKCVAEGGNAAGATRVITLKNGGELTEGLDEYDDKAKMYAYRLSKENIEVFPVSFYSATITVKPAGDGSEVEWVGRFYRADTNNEPPENFNDAAAVKAMQDFMKAGLEGLKAKAEGKS
ncbi:MAG: SRPBCC family protein [Hyphomicrobiaceae bacterium]|nr:SRPBCC family protein [Hyphomicrobiaceae bacterium]